jgi:hypothetical protein
LKDDYLENQVAFTISKPIIPFKESCINTQIKDKALKVKKEFENVGDESSSSSSDEYDSV